jgi:hypothetical protein
MRAAVVPGFGQPLVIEDRPVPEPGPGQVVVQMEASVPWLGYARRPCRPRAADACTPHLRLFSQLGDQRFLAHRPVRGNVIGRR